MIAPEISKIQKSRFVYKFSKQLKSWCQDLETSDSTIVAISRKGPRLIELLIREGLLSTQVLNRVITEHAIPYYVFENHEEILLIDD